MLRKTTTVLLLALCGFGCAADVGPQPGGSSWVEVHDPDGEVVTMHRGDITYTAASDQAPLDPAQIEAVRAELEASLQPNPDQERDEFGRTVLRNGDDEIAGYQFIARQGEELPPAIQELMSPFVQGEAPTITDTEEGVGVTTQRLTQVFWGLFSDVDDYWDNYCIEGGSGELSAASCSRAITVNHGNWDSVSSSSTAEYDVALEVLAVVPGDSVVLAAHRFDQPFSTTSTIVSGYMSLIWLTNVDGPIRTSRIAYEFGADPWDVSHDVFHALLLDPK